MHEKRREALHANVLGVITGQQLTVTQTGRSLESPAREKHCIKRADRLLSNSHLQQERRSIYNALILQIISSQPKLLYSLTGQI